MSPTRKMHCFKTKCESYGYLQHPQRRKRPKPTDDEADAASALCLLSSFQKTKPLFLVTFVAGRAHVQEL
jgi:hypothetical protein